MATDDPEEPTDSRFHGEQLDLSAQANGMVAPYGSVALSNSQQFFFNEINERLGRKTLNVTEPKIILQHQ